MASVLDLVKHYQHAIEKYPNDEQKVLKSIDKLFGLGVTVQHLQETGVGRTVNALRKDPGTVGQAARALVNKWKCMVASEESDQEADQNNDTTNYNGHGNGKDSDDSANRSRSRHNDDSERSYKSDGSRMNGNTSGTKRKYHSSEEEDSSIKKSKHSSSSERESQKRSVKVKQEPSESDDHHDSEDSQSSDSESEISDSSGDDRNQRTASQKIKTEPSENHKSASTKQSLHNHTVEPKKESSSKKSSDNDRHSKTHTSDSRHSSSKSSSREKSQSSHKHKSKDKESSSEKKHKSDHSVEKDKKKEDTNLTNKHRTSSEKHRSSSEKHSHSSEKHRSSSESHKSSSQKDKSDRSKDKHDKNEKRESKSEKHSSQSHKSDKEKQNSSKSSSDKDMQKHKSRESSSSSKEKHSSSSTEKSKDKSSSSKEKSSHSHKSEKKSSHDSKSKRDDSKDKNKVDDSSEKKSKHNSSSSSSHKSEKSSNKSVPKTKPQNNIVDSDDGIDCGSGASFAEALGMASPVKPKKKTVSLKEMSSPNAFNNDLSPASLLAPSAKLAPLPALEISALPEISPNYRPRPPPRLMPHFTDEDAMSHVISSKNQRTKVYSGNKVIGKIPTLYELCVQVLQEHIDALEFTGGVPYEILKPIVDKATPQQLFMLEYHNPYLTEDTDHLWKAFCEKHFRNKKRQEMEAWREMYMRCQEEQEDKLKSLTANIKMTQEAKKAPIKQTKMAYVDSVVKPPRNIARKQAQHGTAFAATASPAARVAALAAAPNVLRGGARAQPAPVLSAGAGAPFKPKKAPLMAKALQFMRGRKR
ncbi:transcription elongation factor B polypeptide 3-like isoform X1 [Leguminivora glycinivorella]|uniref:transcription elongation factor B polypeptide 3-like isoform X1 n=1 Tax=Leguminivora glycinivorella TaxID=1035111 RepID=UPI00200E499E|nr:transcription elongation factor B polypeptide 3-like isoform X1 [Leguminivora glycinivorella]